MAIIVVAILLRANGLEDKALGVDEKNTYTKSVDDALNLQHSHPPVYFWILGLFLKINNSYLTIRIVHVILGVFSVIVTYLLAKQFFKTRVALLTAFMLAILPIHVMYSQQPRQSILLMILVPLSLYFIKRYIDTGDLRFISYTVITHCITFVMYYFVPVYALPQYLYLCYVERGERLRKITYRFAWFGALVILLLPLIYVQFTNAVGEGILPPISVQTILYLFYKFAIMVNLHVVLPEFPILLIIPVVTVILMIVAFYKLWRDHKETFVFFMFNFWGPFVVVLVLGLHTVFWEHRYLVFNVPLYAMLLAYGTYSKRKVWMYIMLAILSIAWTFILVYYYTINPIPEWNNLIGL